MPFHRKGAYDGFDRLAEVVVYYKRCRRLKCFILSAAGVLTEKPVCSVCHRLVTVKDGNRCDYWPRSGKLLVMHYACSWNVLLAKIATLRA